MKDYAQQTASKRKLGMVRWKLLFWLVLAVLALLLIFRSPLFKSGSAGPSCDDRTAAEQLARADLVVAGSVFAVVPNEDTGATVLFSVNRLYKGVVPGRGVEIAALDVMETELGFRTGGDLNFTSNDQPYLLFLRTRSDGRFDTSRCDGSRLLGTGLTQEEQGALGNGRFVDQR